MFEVYQCLAWLAALLGEHGFADDTRAALAMSKLFYYRKEDSKAAMNALNSRLAGSFAAPTAN